MNILFIGDIFGKAGIRAVKENVDKIRINEKIDFVIANAENTTQCRGLNFDDYNELCSYGIDFITMGNHTWHKDEVYDIFNKKTNIIRPYNVKSKNEIINGEGTRIVIVNNKKIRITNLLGQSIDWFNKYEIFNPFNLLDEIIEKDKCEKNIDIHIVDFHGETTSEKNAMLHYFKNRVTAIFGTHTHIQTNDPKIVSNTAYITDAGMTGPKDGIIGASKESIIKKFIGESERFRLTEEEGDYQFNAVILSIDENNIPINIKTINFNE